MQQHERHNGEISSDQWNETAIFGAARIVTLLIEHGANFDAKSHFGVTPRRLLCDHSEELLSLKRQRFASSSPGSVCPGEATRSRFVRWEIGEEEEEDNEPLIDVDMATILAQNDAYFRLPAHQRM